MSQFLNLLILVHHLSLWFLQFSLVYCLELIKRVFDEGSCNLCIAAFLHVAREWHTHKKLGVTHKYKMASNQHQVIESSLKSFFIYCPELSMKEGSVSNVYMSGSSLCWCVTDRQIVVWVFFLYLELFIIILEVF